MSGTHDLTTALRVAQSLLQGIDLDPNQAESQFGAAFGTFFELYNSAAAEPNGHYSRHLVAITIADYARSVLRGETSLETAKIAVSEAVKANESGDFSVSGALGDSAELSQLILQSETEVLRTALRVRRAVEQLSLGQDVQVAAEYVLTLICDNAKRYAVARSNGLTEADGYQIFISTMPIITDIAVECWGRLGNTYFNPTEAVFTQSYVDSLMGDFKTYLAAYDMGLGGKIVSVVDETAAFIHEVAERESRKYDCLTARDREGVCVGIAKHLISISQRAWRLCINNLISEVDDLLADEQKALEWLEGPSTQIDTKALLRAIERVYADSRGFSTDADVDLETLDALVSEEFTLTVQAADAMVEEMSPWSMS